MSDSNGNDVAIVYDVILDNLILKKKRKSHGAKTHSIRHHWQPDDWRNSHFPLRRGKTQCFFFLYLNTESLSDLNNELSLYKANRFTLEEKVYVGGREFFLIRKQTHTQKYSILNKRLLRKPNEHLWKTNPDVALEVCVGISKLKKKWKRKYCKKW